MQRDRELMGLINHLTDAEIKWVIRYLEKAGRYADALVVITITLLTVLIGAINVHLPLQINPE